MGRMVEMDDRMDAKSYLRLTTHEQTMRLMGNAIDDEVKNLAASDGINTHAALAENAPGKSGGLWENKLIQKVGQRLLNWLYRGLHENRRIE